MMTVREAIDKAVADKNDIIFTVSSSMMTETHKAAALNPNVRFLNCSVGGTASSVRCYQGKFYEASFLMGILAADKLLTVCGAGEKRRIAYIAREGGDLKAEYLEFLVTMGKSPVLYVPGNHDSRYVERPPRGLRLHRREDIHLQRFQDTGLRRLLQVRRQTLYVHRKGDAPQDPAHQTDHIQPLRHRYPGDPFPGKRLRRYG